MPKFAKRYWLYYLLMSLLFLVYLWMVYLKNDEWYLVISGLFLWLVYTLFFLFVTLDLKRSWRKAIIGMHRQVNRGQRFAFRKLPYGLLLVDPQGIVEWHNQYVITGMDVKNSPLGQRLDEVFPLDYRRLQEEKQTWMKWRGRIYEVNYDITERFFLFRDTTELVQLRENYAQEQVIVGYLYMDNYDEVLQRLTDREQATLLSQVNRLIAAWTEQYQIALKRFDDDKMFFVTQQRDLERMIQTRFAILDEIRQLTHDDSIPLTLSIGIAHVNGTLLERSEQAQAALNVALARGGDQVAVQDKDRLLFFGGKTKEVEKRTRVRARVISHAMGNLLRDYRRVVIMGHADPDLDAIGAAVGVAHFARAHKCEAMIVLNRGNPSIDRLWQLIQQQPHIRKMFAPSEQIQQWIEQPDTLLILVDTHRPSLTIQPEFLIKTQRVVIIDHHRRGEDFVKNPLLVYLEPYASSTCELVTELLQYHENAPRLEPFEATLLLAGIVVDTKHFAFHTGSRTFEAASFLRRQGADLSTVQSLLKEDLDHYIRRAEMLKNTELWGKEVAVATGRSGEVYDQLLIAQAADTLLNMKGVEASFVIAEREDGLIAISARSQGKINVQLIMEAMGGGGHFTNAACQRSKGTVEGVKKLLREVIADQQNREEKST